MLGRKGEFRSRLFGHVVPLPYIYISQHWRADARFRWSAVMWSRFSVVQELARQEFPDWCPAQHGTLRGKARLVSRIGKS